MDLRSRVPRRWDTLTRITCAGATIPLRTTLATRSGAVRDGLARHRAHVEGRDRRAPLRTDRSPLHKARRTQARAHALSGADVPTSL